VVSILFYSGRRKTVAQELKKIIELQVQSNEIEICRTIQELSLRLHQPLHNADICILLLLTEEELDGVLSLRSLLDGLRILLVLADDGKDVVSKSHKLCPRFITYVDSNLMDIATVLRKMLERRKPVGMAEEHNGRK
jgi:hypothetical protein